MIMMKDRVTVIGGVNMDISAALTAPFVPADSVPGHVTLVVWHETLPTTCV